MKEIFDWLLVMLDEMKRAAIQSRTYYAARNYQRIQTKMIELQMKYNESLRKEPVAAKNTEMTAIEFLKCRDRICRTYSMGYSESTKYTCKDCPIWRNRPDKSEGCGIFLRKYPEKAISIVEKWSAEHPQKTIKDDFFEKFPKANKLCDGIPDACAAKLGYVSECPYQNCEDFCKECWDEPLDEVK